MSYFFEDHPVLARIIACIIIVGLIIGVAILLRTGQNAVFNGNRKVIDTTYGFHWAIIDLGGGEVTEGAVESWCDYHQSDMIQVTLEDGNTYLAHSSKIILSTRRPD